MQEVQDIIKEAKDIVQKAMYKMQEVKEKIEKAMYKAAERYDVYLFFVIFTLDF